MQYIFGYGSLICADSRSRTGVSGPAFPIELNGIARKWSMHSPEWEATAVSAHLESNAVCNGVFFEVDDGNLAKFDAREQGYDRVEIDWARVSSLSRKTLPIEGTLWAYVGKHNNQPCATKPIMQSYVDVILNGCLDYGPEFTQQFINTTERWQNLVNDRQNPFYPRPLKSTHLLDQIDQLLEKHLPDVWKSRVNRTIL